VPTESEIRAIVADLATVLDRAASAEAGDAKESEMALSAILSLTGGQVQLSQEGEAKRKRGWLRGRFRVRLIDTVLARAGCEASGEHGTEIVIDFREPEEAARIADEAKALWDQGLLVKQVATQLSQKSGGPVSRNLVRAALDYWFGSRGQGACPDGRSRRSQLLVKHVIPPRYQEISELVKRLVDGGELLYQIGERPDVNCDRNTVAQALQYWYESRGLPLPPSRGRVRAAKG
jgi:hypothetical protein